MKKKIHILNFYSFVSIEEPAALIPPLLLLAKKKLIKGTVILAKEGFNGGISGSIEDCHKFIDKIQNLTNGINIEIKENQDNTHPFRKLKIKIKKEIVTMGVDNIDINNTGTYISPNKWDEFTSDENIVVIDTRNNYEVSEGTFINSINPDTKAFREFPKWFKENQEKFVGKKIAMFCTGGIRCEKSTAYVKSFGHQDVYHLKGGIIQYLKDTNNKKGCWQGNCFVFDERRIIDDQLHPKK